MMMEEVMSYVMEKLKEALLIMVNFGGQVLLMMVNFVGQLLMKLVNFGGQGLLSLKNFCWQVLLSLQNLFGQVPLALKNFGVHLLLILKNFGGFLLLTLENFGGQVKNFVGHLLLTLENFGGHLLLPLKNFGGHLLLTLKNFGGFLLLTIEDFGGQVKNLCGQIVNWFEEVFPAETRAERMNHWLHVALPYLIITLFLALFIYCCYRDVGLLPRLMNLIKTVWDALIEITKQLCTCCWRSKEPIIKMMKAPGRNIIIPRSIFEANPRLYFLNLRACPGDMLV